MNVYEMFANITAGLMIGTIYSMQTHNTTLDELTETSANLTSAWTTGTPNPKSQLWQDYEGITDNKDMQNFITNDMNNANLYSFSQDFGVDIMETLNNPNVWDKDNSPSQMNIINQYISLITSTAQQDEQSGQNETKTEGSVVQNDPNTVSQFGDMGSQVNGAGGNISSLLAQSY